MNRLIKILVTVILSITLIFAGYYLIYVPYVCDITLSIAKPMNAKEHYFQDIILSYTYMPANKNLLAEEITSNHQEFKKDFYEEHEEDEFHIEIDIKVGKGKTTITYEGTITDGKTGIKKPFKKEVVYDFILTKDIQ